MALVHNKKGNQVSLILQSSFPVTHKVGNVDIFVLPEFEKYDR